MESLSIFKAIFLGAVQGATEFLPVSSSGHLVIFQQWLGVSQNGDFLLAFDVALHLGTLAAVFLFFRRDIFRMDFKLMMLLTLATIPAGICGLAFKNFFTHLFADTLPAAFFLILTGFILWTTKYARPGQTPLNQMTRKQAWLVGAAQAVSILPGVSRSGSTITAGLLLRLMPEAAVRFSFLLSIPAILGATILETNSLLSISTEAAPPILCGIFAAFVIGYVAIRWMLRLVANQKLHNFSWYCWGMGLVVILKELLS